MIVYRIENDKGRGFYHDGFYGYFPMVQYWYPFLACSSHDAAVYFLSVIHPRISDEESEVVYEQNSDWVFGFSSEQDMKSWFPSEILNEIPLVGGKIKKYSIEPEFVKEFSKQCIFNIAKATLIS